MRKTIIKTTNEKNEDADTTALPHSLAGLVALETPRRGKQSFFHALLARVEIHSETRREAGVASPVWRG
jgi:hypothetical protein